MVDDKDLMTSAISSPRINVDRIRILNVDMPQVIQEQIISISQQAISKDHGSSDTAGYIKKECDRLFGPIWHVVVGKSFGSFVTHESQNFIFFYVDNIAVMVFKSSTNSK